MTPEQFGELERELMRIWSPCAPFKIGRWNDDSWLHGVLGERRILDVQVRHTGALAGVKTFWLCDKKDAGYGIFSCDTQEGRLRHEYRQTSGFTFDESEISHWLAIFRKGCFLSGCPLECSAHEQLEWTKWLEDQRRGIAT